MADEEMKTIKDADVDLLTTFGDRIHLYFAENDDWVGQQKETLLKMFDERHRVVHGDSDIPHAFCISESHSQERNSFELKVCCADHGEPLAVQCFEWLKDGGYVNE